MIPQELIISACSSETSSSASARQASTPAIHLHDLLTTTPVQSFKTSTNALHSLAYAPTQNGSGGAIFAVQEGKALINVFAWQRDQMHVKLHLPEKLTCFAVSPNGLWAAGGSANGQLYLWELSSGLLLSSITAHYRTITTLTFTPSSHHILTTSLDSSAHIFLLSQITDPESNGKPYGTLSDHTLPIRALAVSKTGKRAFTASEDGTVKLWSLDAPFELLATFSFGGGSIPISVGVEPAERYFYVGTNKGEVYKVPLYRRRGEVGGVAGDLEAIGGGGLGAAPIKSEGCVINHKSPISCLSLSLSTTHLLLGTPAGEIHIHALPSHQHLRTLQSHSGPITHLSTLLRPPDLTSSGGRSRMSDSYPLMEIKTLERMKVGRTARDLHEPIILLRPNPLQSRLDGLRPPRSRRIIASTPRDTGEGERIASLEAENKKLRANLDKAIKLNERIWNGVVDLHLLPETTDKPPS